MGASLLALAKSIYYLAVTAVVSAVLPSDVIEFAMLPAQRFLRKTKGSSFIIRCQVTST